jgi:hypothetical protein
MAGRIAIACAVVFIMVSGGSIAAATVPGVACDDGGDPFGGAVREPCAGLFAAGDFVE